MSADAIAFLNRTDEIELLASFLPPRCAQSSVLILTAPSGFGKSALTDQLLRSLRQSKLDASIVVVDPDIRTGPGGTSIHEGFFIQRFAEALSAQAKISDAKTFQEFLWERGLRTASEIPLADIIKKVPSLSSAYEIGLDLVGRGAAAGKYSEASLLKSDAHSAVELCWEYVRAVCRESRVVAVVREAQQIDLQSLRSLLEMNRDLPMQHLIIEYTCTDTFETLHAKTILSAFKDHPKAGIEQLRRLDEPYVADLLHAYLGRDTQLPHGYYDAWGGNLRSIDEIKYIASRPMALIAGAPLSLTGLNAKIGSHLQDLDRDQKMLLAIIFSHREGINQETLLAIASKANPQVPPSVWIEGIGSLVEHHHFIAHGYDVVRLNNEDLATVIEASPEFTGLNAIATNLLREHYLDILVRSDYASSSMSVAIRQAILLCAKTGDITSISDLTRKLSSEIRAANDQSVYVDAVLFAISKNGAAFPGEGERLLNWCADLAYDTGDFQRAHDILALKHDISPANASMLACCLQELGRHPEALEIADQGKYHWSGTDGEIASDLIRFLVFRDLGDVQRARELLHSVLGNESFLDSPLRGYGLRFSESIRGLPSCLDDALASITWFQRFGFVDSCAYSQLAAAMHAARLGDPLLADELLAAADRHLSTQVRDQPMLLNNRAAISMLSDDVDFEECGRMLARAMRSSRDDYSDVTILNNMAIVNAKTGKTAEAKSCMDRALRILESPQFCDKDIFWEVAYTARSVYRDAGEEYRVQQVLQSLPRQPLVNTTYWNYRFGFQEEVGTQYGHLLKFDYHPLFLSHWLIDREGLETLKARLPE